MSLLLSLLPLQAAMAPRASCRAALPPSSTFLQRLRLTPSMDWSSTKTLLHPGVGGSAAGAPAAPQAAAAEEEEVDDVWHVQAASQAATQPFPMYYGGLPYCSS